MIFSVSSHTQNKEEFKVVRFSGIHKDDGVFDNQVQFFRFKLAYKNAEGSILICVNVEIKLTANGPKEYERKIILELREVVCTPERLDEVIKFLWDKLMTKPAESLKALTNQCWCNKCLAENDTRPIYSSVDLN